MITRKVASKHKNKYRYYKWVDWTRPNFTSNTGPNGELCSGTYSEDGHEPYEAVNGVFTADADNEWNGYKWYSTWTMTLPYTIKITALTHYNRWHRTRSNLVGQFFANIEKTIPIGNSFSTPETSWYVTNIAGIPSEGIETNVIHFAKTSGDDYNGIGELLITAKYAVESNASDYDYRELIE